ncbi:FAD-dependent oxidoreductase [Permianibacter sp. IMCC34836]|uniref:FAD-dependent oxidoreductase n=1 Tax=Permianibacter fluminis TaxID=2738515 RepID=UPI0015532692|nr:FAD-dependent oxidoreductase [Permianibacter fluminis]NQD36416.1 FAD-dependent oxidoreductase [Permianibacter fluminis]
MMPTPPPEDFDCDLLVIGAGIHGAAVAREAAARGWRVIVLEQYGHAAAATSSHSSKLIHGGLRYLETGQLKLVYECLREQRILLRTASQLVHKQRFFIPVRDGMRRPGWLVHCGLLLYWLLGGSRPQRLKARHGETDGLLTRRGMYLLSYHDAQTDDAPLTAAVLASAELMGAELRYRCTVESLALSESGASVTYRNAAGESVRVQARAVANLSGPWVRELLATVQPAQALPAIELVKGSHIVLPQPPQRGCYYLEAEDGRAVFVMPWRGQRLVGTTESPFTGNPATATPDDAEMDYLLRTHNHYFAPTFRREDIIDSWSGLRVLPQGSGNAFKRPRESVLLTDRPQQPRLLSLIGGKLTSHRATAEQICNVLAATLPATTDRIDTRRQMLPAVNLPIAHS